MAKRIIEIEVNDEYVLGSGVVIGAAGSDNSVILRAKFNDTWAGLNIYATFRDSKGESPSVLMLMPSMLVPGESMTYDVEVPAAATAFDGKMSLVFSGFAVTSTTTYDAATETYDNLVYRDAVINTANAYFRVLQSDFSALDVEDQEEATLLEQVLGEINVFRTELTEAENGIEETLDGYDERIEAIGAEEAQRVIAEEERAAAREEFESTVNAKLAAQDTKLAGRLGKGESVTLLATEWSNENVQAITIEGLGDDDMVIFYPATADDREYCGYYGVFVSPKSAGSAFTVTARAKPVFDIALRYYVIRGKLPEVV